MIININLLDNRVVEYDNSIIGKTYENDSTILKFNLTEEMLNKDFYLEFEKEDGTKYSTPKLEIKTDESEIIKTKGIVEYELPNSVLDLKGLLKVEVVLRYNEEVWKSFTLVFTILESINASEDIPEKFPDIVNEMQKIINIIKTDGDGTKYLSDDGIYKSVQGGGGTSDYNLLENKPSINNIELTGNKTLEDLGIDQDFVKDNNYVHTDNNYTTEEKTKLENVENYDDTQIKTDISTLQNEINKNSQDINNLGINKADKTEIPDISNFITKDVNDLTNYYNKTEVDNKISTAITEALESDY